VATCESTDPRLNAHIRGLRKMFEDSANVYVYDSSEDGKSFLLFIESPRDPPGFYFYLTETRRIEAVGTTQDVMTQVMLPRASVVRYAARDGQQLSGYLTVPAKAPKDLRLPLVIFPHGGPEARDSLSFETWNQYFVSLGYAVFQPNFRGSDGFGKAFAESGYGEWGRKMQDDISDAVKTLVDQGVADPQRVCIVGASYGGYAALAGASLTPDLYKCAVSVAGISDLTDFIAWRKRTWNSDSATYVYMLKAIGNPDTDAQRLREVSPLQQVSKIKAPVLLVHGTDDYIVPISQSRMMKRVLDQAGRKTELIEVEHEGHPYFSKKSELYALSNIGAFLWKHLGAGYGVTTAPEARAKPE
jgi:dipeptidyl aminopeptidase/acylaminoacyl peptidase